MDAIRSGAEVDGVWRSPPRSPERIPRSSGVYQLWLEIDRPVTLRIGALGRLSFPPGTYIYSGSARNGLRARVARHLRRRNKSFHWHIDYLRARCRLRAVRWWCSAALTECMVHRRALRELGGGEFPAPFGASDCDCRTHLVFVPTGPESTPEVE